MKHLAICVLTCAVMATSVYGATVDFDQLDWLADGGGYEVENSEYGQMNLLLTSADMASCSVSGSGYIGFVNLVTTVSGGGVDNWAVRNVPVYFDDADAFNDRIADTFWFDLGTTRGADVTSLDYSLTLSGTPLTSAPTGGLVSTSVTAANIYAGGENVGAGEGLPGVTPPPPPSPPIDIIILGFFGIGVGDSGSINITDKQVEDVGETPNGCAPGAATRSLKYLAKQGVITITDSTSTVYTKLYSYMNTSALDGTIIDPNFKNGKDQYSNELGGGTKVVETEIGVTDIDRIIQALKAGADVEMGVYWGLDSNGDSMGGHCVFVTQVDKFVDGDGNMIGYKVTYIDDPDQDHGTSGDGTNNKKRFLYFDKDGHMYGPGAGTGASLNDFRIETPEPATLSLLGMGALALLKRRKR